MSGIAPVSLQEEFAYQPMARLNDPLRAKRHRDRSRHPVLERGLVSN